MGESRKAKKERLAREMAARGLRLHVEPRPVPKKVQPKEPPK